VHNSHLLSRRRLAGVSENDSGGVICRSSGRGGSLGFSCRWCSYPRLLRVLLAVDDAGLLSALLLRALGIREGSIVYIANSLMLVAFRKQTHMVVSVPVVDHLDLL
jgi:hypothetical protein